MSVELWAPPNVTPGSVRAKVDEWRRKNPTKPPYERFLQDYISSQWPVLWHLKRKFILDLNCTEPIEESSDNEMEVCAICRCSLSGGTEVLSCLHSFHTMCIHRWLQRASTCPMCRAEI